MGNSFFERLFQKNDDEFIDWSVHTTMTCDLAYSSALLDLQENCDGNPSYAVRSRNLNLSDRMAVFYYKGNKAGDSQKKSLTISVASETIPVKELKKIHFPVTSDTTFHAKLSLVRIRKTNSTEARYRLAVYTKNMAFNENCAEAALLFDLKLDKKQTESGKQLRNFFRVLKSLSEGKEGKDWLDKHGLNYRGEIWKDLKRCTLVSEYAPDMPVELYFGGCETGCTLGERLRLNQATKDSIVLTPPEFQRGTAAWDYFKTNYKNNQYPQLYDLNQEKAKELATKTKNKTSLSSSHIKLYLLQRETEKYELWVGSANATAHGIGWDFKKGQSPVKESIECLVKFQLNYDGKGEERFNQVKKIFLEPLYCPFSFNDGESGSLKVEEDPFGPYFCSNFNPTSIAYFDKDENLLKGTVYSTARYVEIAFRKTADVPNEKEMNKDACVWHPAEYGFSQQIDDQTVADILNAKKGDTICLRLEFSKFKPAQGMLCFGPSNSLMDIQGILDDAGIPQNDGRQINTTLSEWLKNPDALDDELLNAPEGLCWMHTVLKGNAPGDLVSGSGDVDSGDVGQSQETLPALDGSNEILKPQQLPFQRNATGRLCEILEKSSRAFLADEPGLGKTYSAAGVIYYHAKKQWERQKNAGEKPSPFYAIYVAPNTDLLDKNCNDIIDKMNRDFLANDTAGIQIMKISEVPLNKTPENAPDRVAFLMPYMKAAEKQGQCIILIPLSIHQTSASPRAGSEEEQKQIGNDNDRCGAELAFLGQYQPGLVLWDEYHRYAEYVQCKRLANAKSAYTPADINKVYIENAFVMWERTTHANQCPNAIANQCPNAMKSLFISATPYQTNISGENSNALESLHSYDDDDEKIEPLPSFGSFVYLMGEAYCFENGWKPRACSNSSAIVVANPIRTVSQCHGDKESIAKEIELVNRRYIDDILEANRQYSETLTAYKRQPKDQLRKKDFDDAKQKLQDYLSAVMVRHERTRLQCVEEEHKLLYPANSLYRTEYHNVLRNTFRQNKALADLGYSEAARLWAESMPWVLSFSAKNKFATSKETESNYFECMIPTEELMKQEQEPENLFAYASSGEPKSCLKDLPEQNLAMHQICQKNLVGEMAQLLWMPPTVPLYKPEGIYNKYEGYSKLLVFAEYTYLQRGGAVLLSDYAKLLNRQQKSPCPGDFPPPLDYAKWLELEDNEISFSLTSQDFRGKSLDEVLEATGREEKEEQLALVASPAACAKGLGLDAAKVENAFNVYFRRDGVRDALWAWMCEREYTEAESWKLGILRYCAEGNLYAVLEEYCFVNKSPEMNLLKVLGTDENNNPYRPSKVFVQTFETSQNNAEGKERTCSFADRLTSDINDTGTGAQKTNVRTAIAEAFSSPFWPMIMFAGRGAQEGMDFHQYCLRIMHMTIPRGAVSLEQRQGRIDRYRSLLVRRRAAEKLGHLKSTDTCEKLLWRMFAKLMMDKQSEASDNQLYPHWSIPNRYSRWHFERMIPVWEFTNEYDSAETMINMLKSYRASFGVSSGAEIGESIDLSAPESDGKDSGESIKPPA